MDKNSNTYKFLADIPTLLEEMGVASVIVDVQGDCTGLNLCIKCPFANECFKKIADESAFLDRDVRLRKAEEFIFNKLIEDELE